MFQVEIWSDRIKAFITPKLKVPNSVLEYMFNENINMHFIWNIANQKVEALCRSYSF